MKIKISFKEIRRYLNIKESTFPKYVAPLINLANQFAQGTRPRVVGQMSELIKEFEGSSIEEWENWYTLKQPQAIREATERILQKLQELNSALKSIDRATVEEWVRDLVIVKTYIGFRFQEAILKKGAELKGVGWRFANPEEEAKGIDGFIGEIPVSIKPETYRSKAGLPEDIQVKIIYYKKAKDGIEVDYSDVL